MKGLINVITSSMAIIAVNKSFRRGDILIANLIMLMIISSVSHHSNRIDDKRIIDAIARIDRSIAIAIPLFIAFYTKNTYVYMAIAISAISYVTIKGKETWKSDCVHGLLCHLSGTTSIALN